MKPNDLPATAHDAPAFDTRAFETRASETPTDPPQAHTAAVPRILIVDDDPGTVQALGRMLDGVGELHFACSGAEALRMARDQRPDLVLLDAEMPGMNGFEVCHALKADPALASVAVIFVTSHGEPSYEVEALGVGAADFIAKPPMAEQVLARVRARLRNRAAAVPPAAAMRGARHAPTRLLLADSDDAALHFGRIALAPMVDTVLFARSGAEALALMAREPVHVAVVTLQLPDMDGFALARRLRADPALCHVSLLLVGPRTDWRSEAQAFGLGASDFMARPFPPEVLQARVRNLLRQRHDAEAGELARRSAWQRLGDARVADLVAAAPDAWLAVDADGRIVLANTAAGWRLGVEPARLLGRPLAELQAGHSWPGAAATWPLGEGSQRLTAMRLGAAEDAQ